MITSHKIAIDTNQQRIYYSSEFRRTNHDIYLALTALWDRSAALRGDPPLWYCYDGDVLGCAPEWSLELP